jgi:MYXO-CTERM domain-containing protein
MGKSACINGATACNGWVGPGAEICDGVDNDCDGVVDDSVPGVGNQCGINQPPCTPGLTACVGGALVCQGGTGPNPEVCDGVDNDCDGQADETPLVDAPASAGCWTEPAASCNPTCQHQGLTWCPPPGGTCNGVGALTPPCKAGTLACGGAAGWVCQGPKTPAPEACDGLDNDCDGTVDEGPIPQVGQPCGSDVGECTAGLLDCNAGILDCVNDVGPTPEICDGLDNDCDGVVDNGIPAGAPCTPPLPPGYTGAHDKAPCQPGVLICDGMGGLVCTGGVGPSPEVCDAIDNDCDGSVDETGAPPEGIDGTQNPTPPPDAAIGDPCGIDTGECKQGAYACVNGQFACLGSQGPEPEACDCGDNDCNGVIDNENPMNMPPLCSPGNTCVNAPGIGCQCAEPCSGGEVECTPGFTCVQVTDPNDPRTVLGPYCVVDNCGDCSLEPVQDGEGKVICAPEGTPPDADCNVAPVCTCKGQNCDAPCAGVTCAAPEVCTNYGAKAGTCVTNDCYNVPCQGCDSVCNAGSCQDDACVPNPCVAGEICKNTYDEDEFECLSPCGAPCPRGEVCDESTGQCVGDQCGSVTCDGGTCCDPVTGACGNCPCEGVVCPGELQCDNGDCIEPSQGQGGAGGTGGSSAASTGAGNAGGSTPDGAGGDDRAIWGLSTGGGGCACGAAGASSTAKHGGWALLAVALGLWRRRRTAHAPAPRRAAHVEVR